MNKKMFKSLLKSITFENERFENANMRSLVYNVFSYNNLDEDEERKYTIRGVTQGVEWDEPCCGHVGPMYKVIWKSKEGDLSLLKYWWQEKPSIVCLGCEYDAVYELYKFMKDNGYIVNERYT